MPHVIGESKVDYGLYMASREWRLKRKQVIERSDGWCYRCQSAKIRDVHHLTYERLGHEDLDDLQGLCQPCHEYISGERDDDPAERVILELLEHGLEAGPIRYFGLRAWWETKPLPNGNSWCLDWVTSPRVDTDMRPISVFLPVKDGLWLQCWWA